ncbi:hypothetical protein FPV67DRAFT_238929 [Lyophyllum atratum]|nr:hypothetical protein FPV67DRAFT_238929 [Lyophyllum atratum]
MSRSDYAAMSCAVRGEIRSAHPRKMHRYLTTQPCITLSTLAPNAMVGNTYACCGQGGCKEEDWLVNAITPSSSDRATRDSCHEPTQRSLSSKARRKPSIKASVTASSKGLRSVRSGVVPQSRSNGMTLGSHLETWIATLGSWACGDAYGPGISYYAKLEGPWRSEAGLLRANMAAVVIHIFRQYRTIPWCCLSITARPIWLHVRDAYRTITV